MILFWIRVCAVVAVLYLGKAKAICTTITLFLEKEEIAPFFFIVVVVVVVAVEIEIVTILERDFWVGASIRKNMQTAHMFAIDLVLWTRWNEKWSFSIPSNSLGERKKNSFAQFVVLIYRLFDSNGRLTGKQTRDIGAQHKETKITLVSTFHSYFLLAA